MCGRFTLRTPPHAWCQMYFPGLELEQSGGDPPRYNIAPTQSVFGVFREEIGGLPIGAKLRWGLVPPWADDLNVGNRMINARSETIDSKRSFKKAFAQRRCLIAADGYYEWKKTTDGKQPFLIERADEEPFAFAGLWEENSRAAAEGETIRSCTIITTAASAAMKQVHDRMPVILSPEQFDRWIDPGFRDVANLKTWLTPADDDTFKLIPVSTHVNNPRHEDARCVGGGEG